jgi:DNA sulfur modification protein DndB
MATTFPSLHGRMGDIEYFVAICTVGEAARIVQYAEEVDGWTPASPPELKLQRKLNTARVEREMVPYLLENSDHFYGALTVEVRPAADAGPDEPVILFDVRDKFPGAIEFGLVTLDGSEILYALDGQHRLKSLELAIREQPQLAREQIALILLPFRSIAHSQSMFSDLNRYARAPSKSMSLLFTHREALARVAKNVCGRVPVLKDRVNMESTTLSRNARQFITLSTLYEMTRILVGSEVEWTSNEDQAIDELTGIWEVLTEAIPQWQMVASDQEHPAYLRARYLNMHGVCQQAIGAAVSAARLQQPKAWPDLATQTFQRLDWGLANPDWQGVALHGGRVNNTSTSIRSLSALLQAEMGLQAPAIGRVDGNGAKQRG